MKVSRLLKRSIDAVSEELKKVVDEQTIDKASSVNGLMPAEINGDTLGKRLGFAIKHFDVRGRIIEYLEAVSNVNPDARDTVNGIIAQHLKTQIDDAMAALAGSQFGVIERGQKDLSFGEGKLKHLHRLVQKEPQSIDHAALLFRMIDSGLRVCRIEQDNNTTYGRAMGTGFLVDKNLVLTNWHVMEPVENGEIAVSAVRCRFDYQMDPTGTILSAGKTVKLATTKWNVASSPLAPIDYQLGGREPTRDELDYCCVRINQDVGTDLVMTGSVPRPRDWYHLDGNLAAAPAKGDELIVVGHCEGKPLTVARGEMLTYKYNDLRLYHDAYTLPGSSGSPVFDAEYRIVALHHAGDPDDSRKAEYNQAIPISLIAAHSSMKRKAP